MKYFYLWLLLMPLQYLHAETGAPEHLPRVFVLDTKTLQQNKNRVFAKDALILPAYHQLIKDAEGALLFGPVSVMEKKHMPPSGDKHDYMSLAPYFWPNPNTPNGLPYIRKDGETNPEVKEYKDKEYLPKLCEQVYTLGLAWYFSGDEKYAAHASRLLTVWFLDPATKMNPHLNFGQSIKGVTNGRGAGLIDTRHFVKLIEGIGLLNGAQSWTPTHQQNMQAWFASFLEWMQSSTIGLDEMDAPNNHGVWYDAQRLSMALYTNNNVLARKVVENALIRLDTQMNDQGRFPKEMVRTISLHYSVFVMDAFVVIARMGKHAGIDVWNYVSPSGKSLQKGFQTLYPFLLKPGTWDGPQIKPFDAEEGYDCLFAAKAFFNCKECSTAIQSIAGDKFKSLRFQLLNL